METRDAWGYGADLEEAEEDARRQMRQDDGFRGTFMNPQRDPSTGRYRVLISYSVEV